MCSLVQAFTLTVELQFLIHCSNNRLIKFTVGALRTDLSEFQGQNFKVGGHTGGTISLFLHTGRKATRMCEASPHCYNLAHIYVSWRYVWKYTNVKVTFLPIKTISICLTIFVLQILGSNLLRWAILKSLIYFDIGFQLNGNFFSTYNSIWYVLLR